MAKKDVEEYYNKICEVYHELLEDTKQLEQDATENIISPEFVENYKKKLEPIKENYERWSYMIFLLNMPNRKEKKKKYTKQQLGNLKDKDLDECKNTMKEIKDRA